MRFLPSLQLTKVSTLRLLDIAYLVVLAPLFFIIKLPMILFMFIVLILLVTRKSPTTLTTLMTLLVGVVALFLAQYGTFNVSGLSRLKVFLEFLVYLLIIAIALQRLTRVVNFYLVVSPMLLLALSLFFFDSIAMLLYVVFEVFVLIWVILTNRMYAHAPAGSLGFDVYGRATLRMSAMMFLHSLPWVVLLFLIFPRISFEHATYGFRGDTERRTGHDGMMYLDNQALLVPSERVVMEVGFERPLTADIPLYFRGSILYRPEKTQWLPLSLAPNHRSVAKYKTISQEIRYKIKLYPTQLQWLYLLDLPIDVPTDRTLKVTLDSDFIATTKKPIIEPLHYQGHSALTYELDGAIDTQTLIAASRYDHDSDPKSIQIAREIKEKYPTSEQRATAILDVFKTSDLTYTLKPAPLDLNNSVDSFLFDHKRGYCVHYASAFALMARMADIPSRIVTGFRADLGNSINDYLVIKENNAHAWVELFIVGQWRRYEPTSTATHMEDTTAQNDTGAADEKGGRWEEVNLYLMYMKYQIDTWILGYSHFRQMKLLDDLRDDPMFLLQLVGTFIALIIATILAVAYIKRPRCLDVTLCTLQPLLDRLAKEGHTRQNKETMAQFLTTYAQTSPKKETLLAIATLYQKLRYSPNATSDELKRLKALVGEFLKS